MPKIGPQKWHKPLKDRAKKWEILPPRNIELGEAEGSFHENARAPRARARAPFSIKIKINPWMSNETLEEVTQKAKFDRKMKKIGHRGKQGKKRGEKRARRTSGRRPDVRREIYF